MMSSLAVAPSPWGREKSGAAALLLTDDPTMSHSQVVEGLKSIAIDLGEPGVDTYYGYGLVNLKNWQMHDNTSELKTESIQILPGKVSVTKLTNVSNGIKIKWKKASTTQINSLFPNINSLVDIFFTTSSIHIGSTQIICTCCIP